MYTINLIFTILSLTSFRTVLNEENTFPTFNNSEIRTILRRAHPFLKTLHLTNNMLQFLDDMAKDNKSGAETTTLKELNMSPSTISTPQIYLIQKELLNYLNKAIISNHQLENTTFKTTPMISKPNLLLTNNPLLDQVRKALKRQMPSNTTPPHSIRTTVNYLHAPTTPVATSKPTSLPIFTAAFTALPNFDVSLNVNLDKLTKRYMPMISQDRDLRIPNPNLPVAPNIGQMISLAAQLALSTPTPINPDKLTETINLEEFLKGTTEQMNELIRFGSFGAVQPLVSLGPPKIMESQIQTDISKLNEVRKVNEQSKIKYEAAKLNEAFEIIEAAFRTTPTPSTITVKTPVTTPITTPVTTQPTTKPTQKVSSVSSTNDQEDLEPITPKINGETIESTMQSFQIITERAAFDSGITFSKSLDSCDEDCGPFSGSVSQLVLNSSPEPSNQVLIPTTFNVSEVPLTTVPVINKPVTEAVQLDVDLGVPNKKGKVSKEKLEEIRAEIGEIKMGKYKGKKEGMPCCLQGSWISDAAGVVFNINKEQSTEFTINVEEVSGKLGFFVTLDWEVTAFMPFRKTSFIIMTAIHQKDLRMASFSGDCRICDGNEFISGHWLLSKNESRCEEMSEAQESFGDLWKRKN